MAQEFSKAFYNSAKWQSVRQSVLARSGGLCERCWSKGIVRAADVVHHRTVLTPANIHDPQISLNPAGLEALCQDCHAAAHAELEHGRRYVVDKNGNVVTAEA